MAVTQRLAFSFGSYTDDCSSNRPYLDGLFVPDEIKEEKNGQGEVDRSKARAVPKGGYCIPGMVRREGSLPFTALQGGHSADDVVLTAMDPGAEQFRGHIDNTRVFRAMAIALGLGRR